MGLILDNLQDKTIKEQAEHLMKFSNAQGFLSKYKEIVAQKEGKQIEEIDIAESFKAIDEKYNNIFEKVGNETVNDASLKAQIGDYFPSIRHFNEGFLSKLINQEKYDKVREKYKEKCKQIDEKKMNLINFLKNISYLNKLKLLS